VTSIDYLVLISEVLQLQRQNLTGCNFASSILLFLLLFCFLVSALIKFHSQYFCFTGQPSWGIAWYINDKLIPEIYVERGQTYAFVVEGGNDRTNPARYHPFYITDSSEGGFGQKSEAEQKKQRVFGGVNYDSEGYPYPTAGELLVYLVIMTKFQMTNAPSGQGFNAKTNAVTLNGRSAVFCARDNGGVLLQGCDTCIGHRLIFRASAM